MGLQGGTETLRAGPDFPSYRYYAASAHIVTCPWSCYPPGPQIECCIRCLSQGVSASHIIDGRAKHSILMELLTDEGVGTMITG